MKFKLPKDLASLDADALAKLLNEAIAEYTSLVDVEESDLTDEQISDLEALSEAVNAINAESQAREQAAADRAERIAKAKGLQLPSDEDGDEDEESEEDDEEPDEDEDDDEGDEPDENADADEVEEKEKELVASGGKPRRSVARRAAAKVDTRPAPNLTPKSSFSFRAAADVPTYSAGQDLETFTGAAAAVIARSRNFRSMRGIKGQGLMRYSAAKMVKSSNEFAVSMDMPVAEQLAIIDKAADEKRLPKGGLVATGGWCAPSETLYDFVSLETIDGILSIPEVTINRGGINFTTGPSYADISSDWGFLQTEAQAEAGTEKTCYTVECPPFEEVRLDAIGFCVRSGLLSNSAYPELLRRVLEIGAVAHAHKVNASVLSRIGTALGTALDWTEIGSGTADLLNALELNAEVLRYKYSLAIGATLEVVLPAWARLIARQDLAVREGADSFMNITDQQLNTWFATRGLAVQFVYDFQPLATTGASVGKAMPTTVEAYMYPAGTFIKGTTDVIDLDAVYDSDSLSTNDFTAAFFEEGLLVAQRGLGGAKIDIALNYKGATGFPAIGSGSGITFAPAA